MTVSLIVAHDLDGVIGRDGALPWHLKGLSHFPCDLSGWEVDPATVERYGIDARHRHAFVTMTAVRFPDTLVGALAVPRVRRITPRECERLQGFPDDYTLVAHKGKPAADGNRYKAIGNSMAVNVMRWIGARISSREG